MKKDRLAWFPFYAGDWIASCFVTELRPISRAFYVDLLCFQWTAKGGGLPSDSDELRKLVRASKTEWSRAWPELVGKFPIADNGRRYNPRLDEEWEREGARSARQKAASRAANLARWGSESESETESETVSESGPSRARGEAEAEDDVTLLAKSDVDTAVSTPATNGRIDWAEQAHRWNTIATANGLPILRSWNAGRKKELRARLREDPEFWAQVNRAIERRSAWARENRFPTFDQAINARIFPKLVEGNYEDKGLARRESLDPQVRKALGYE